MTKEEIYNYIDSSINNFSLIPYLKMICDYNEYYSDNNKLNLYSIQNYFNIFNDDIWVEALLTYCIYFPSELDIKYYLKDNDDLYFLTKEQINNCRIKKQKLTHPKTKELFDYKIDNILFIFFKPNHIKTKLENILNSYSKEYNIKTGVIENELDEYIWSGDVDEIVDKIYEELIKK